MLHAHGELDVYSRTNSGLYGMNLSRLRHVITNEHVTFDEGFFPFVRGHTTAIILKGDGRNNMEEERQSDVVGEDVSTNILHTHRRDITKHQISKYHQLK